MRAGDRVEVSSREIGYEGSWFEAMLLEERGAMRKVRYADLVDEQSGAPLEESVAAELVRPVPPPLRQRASRSYRHGDAVEAYSKDGWWVGSIVNVLGRGEYSVYFRDCGEEGRYTSSQLRLRQDWHKGKWRVVTGSAEPLIKKRRKKSEYEEDDDTTGDDDVDTTEEDEEVAAASGFEAAACSNRRKMKMEEEAGDEQEENDNGKGQEIGKSPTKTTMMSGGHGGARRTQLKSPSDISTLTHHGSSGAAEEEMCEVRKLELLAYSKLLQAFRSRSADLTWRQEQVISELRLLLDVDNDTHIQQLRMLQFAEGQAGQPRCSDADRSCCIASLARRNIKELRQMNATFTAAAAHPCTSTTTTAARELPLRPQPSAAAAAVAASASTLD